MTAKERQRLEGWLRQLLHRYDLQLVKCGGGLYKVTDRGGLRVTDQLTLEEVKAWIEEN